MRRRWTIAAGVGLFMTNGSWAEPTTHRPQDAGVRDETSEIIKALQEQVAELQKTVAELRAAQNTGDDWLTEQRADQIRMLVQDVLADADTRASLMDDALTAGYDGGFFIASADGNYRLRISGQLQIRYAYNHRGGNVDNNDLYGFEIRRAKVKLDGHVFDPSWQYEIQIADDHDSRQFSAGAGSQQFSGEGDMFLENAFIRKDFENGLVLSAGQFKLPFLHEELVSSTRQLAVERSLVNAEFSLGRGKAVMLAYTGDRYRLQGAFSDGANSLNTPFNFVPLMSGDPGADLAVTIRGDWIILGDWKQFAQFTSPRGNDTGIRVGAAVDYERDKYDVFVLPGGGVPSPITQFLTWTIDAEAQFSGANVFTYFVARHTETAGAGWMNDYGVVVQGGFYVTDDLEAYARYEWGQAAGTASDLNVITVGATWYFNKHNIKWASDIGVGLTPVVSAFATQGADWLTDSPGTSGQIVVRSQLQLLF